MSWKEIAWLAVCAGLLCMLAACSEKAQMRVKGETVIGGSVENHK